MTLIFCLDHLEFASLPLAKMLCVLWFAEWITFLYNLCFVELQLGKHVEKTQVHDAGGTRKCSNSLTNSNFSLSRKILSLIRLKRTKSKHLYDMLTSKDG